VAETVCDITDADSVRGLAEAARARGIRALAHVAALAPSVGDWRKLMTVNLIGAHRVAEVLMPLCGPGAAAVFIASFAGHVAQSNAAIDALVDDPLQPGFLDKLEAALGPERANPSQAYVFSKYALIRYCERLAVRWGPNGVRAVSFSPGLVLSAMGARERAHNPVTRTFAAQTPLRREASILEMAAVIDFITSDAASFLTGVDILADGGLRAAGRWPAAGAEN